MESVFPANQLVLALLGPPRDIGEQLRLTRWCVRTPCKEGELLYNTLTGEMLLRPEGEALAQSRALLAEKRFLVPESQDEYARAKELKALIRRLQPKSAAVENFLIYTTTDCNARCYYCYELGYPRQTMSDQVADDTAACILRVSGDRGVTIQWFGGEPMYNRRAIERITARLREAGKPFRSTMASNGYLFDGQTVKTAVEDWKLRSIQLVLDGTEEVYNRTKAYIYGDDPSPYRRVLRNIGLFIDAGVAIHVRLNLGTDNFEDLKALGQELGDRFGGRGGFYAYVAPLQDYGGSPQDSVPEEERIRRFLALNKVLESQGLARHCSLPKKPLVYHCMADHEGSVTVLPDGSLGKCEHENQNDVIGSIYEGVTDPARAAAWQENVEGESCRACALYPRCRRLKKCAWIRDGCRPLDRAVQRELVVRQMLYTYEHRDGSSRAPEGDGGGLC